MYYRLYRQTVVSDFPLNKFGVQQLSSPLSSELIHLQFIESSKDKYVKFLNYQTHSKDSYGYYYVKNIAFFEVFSGKKIVVNYFNEIDDDLIHTLLNYPFAILFNQRKKYVIHASSINYKNKVFCFCGKSQSGKSSLASHLIKKGGSLISEDTCVFDYIKNNLVLLPSYNFLKISDEVNEYNDSSLANPIYFKKKTTDRKGYILDEQSFVSEPVAVDHFIYLQWSDSLSNIEHLNDENSLEKLFSNEFISYDKESALSRFKSASTLVSKANHFLYSRKKDLSTLDDFIKIFNKKFL